MALNCLIGISITRVPGCYICYVFNCFFSSRRRHTSLTCDWSSDVCSSDLCIGSKVVVTAHELTWDMVPYDVQLIGGIVLHQGRIAEMATGEGKTLVATLPLYLNALAGRG